MQRIRVLLVDDEARVRIGLRMRLKLEPDIEVVGEAVDGEAALAAASEARPDVVVMDVRMKGVDGIVATRLLRERLPACAVVMLTMHDSQETRADARAAGAVAFVAKHEDDGALVDAIRSAASEESARDTHD